MLQRVVGKRTKEEISRQLPDEKYGDKLMMEKGDELIERAEALEAWVEIFIGGDVETFDQFDKMEVKANEGSKLFEGENSADPNRYPERLSEAVMIDVRDRQLVTARSNSQRPSFDQSELAQQTQLFYTPILQENPLRYTYKRQEAFAPSERVLMVVTMYNETEEEFKGTFEGISENLEYIAENGEVLGFGGGEEGYKDFLICVVSDGEAKASESTLEYGHNMGIYDAQVKEVASLGMDVHVHLFERIIQLQKGREIGGPIKTLFALKKYNKGKLHSHNWFFNAFARNIMPEYTVLLDVGTVPTKTAIWRLLRSMTQDQRIAGVCGEIEIEPKSLSYLNMTIATQNFEYKISHILDKSLESFCGFISVLPGAFSAYRFECIQGKPLDEYFTLEHEENQKNASPFTVNMYLAEVGDLQDGTMHCTHYTHYTHYTPYTLYTRTASSASSFLLPKTKPTSCTMSRMPWRTRTPLTRSTSWSGSAAAGSTALDSP
jgi:hypothetical protein